MSTTRKGATITTDHRKREAAVAQGVLLENADFLREIVQRVLQEVLVRGYPGDLMPSELSLS
jgi:hypothetical protein